MARETFGNEAKRLRLTPSEYLAIPETQPKPLSEQPVGTRWLEEFWAGTRVRVLTHFGPDGPVIESYKPIIRIPAINRHVPRAEVRS
jgi:hypothetical protein